MTKVLVRNAVVASATAAAVPDTSSDEGFACTAQPIDCFKHLGY
jgi:hypothetical protein